MSKLNSYWIFVYLCLSSFFLASCIAFQSDELLQDDEEFGLEGGLPLSSRLDLDSSDNIKIPIISPPTPSIRKSIDDSDSKIQFTLEHAFGDSDFVPAGTFTARLKSWSHGGQTLTKLRFSRNSFTDSEKEDFKQLLKDDEFYRIRLPSNVLSPPGKDYIVSSVKARCLPRDGLDEHFVIHMESVNILAVNYGSPGACPYPRPFKLPTKWSFNSHTVLRNSEQAPRAPAFVEDILIGGEKNAEGENVPQVEKTFGAKYLANFLILIYFPVEAKDAVFEAIVNLKLFLPFSVDVSNPSSAHCHECCDPSYEHARGTSCWWSPSSSTRSSSCCYSKKVVRFP